MNTQLKLLRLPSTCARPYRKQWFASGSAYIHDAFPEMLAESHRGERLNFRDDCVGTRGYVVNFLSLRDYSTRRACGDLARTIELLGPRVGHDIVVSSITLEPLRDNTERLAKFAESLNAPFGWRFLRMLPRHCAALCARLCHQEPSGPESRLIFYGNVATGTRGFYPATTAPEDAAVRVASVFDNVRTLARPPRTGPTLCRPGSAHTYLSSQKVSSLTTS